MAVFLLVPSKSIRPQSVSSGYGAVKGTTAGCHPLIGLIHSSGLPWLQEWRKVGDERPQIFPRSPLNFKSTHIKLELSQKKVVQAWTAHKTDLIHDSRGKGP